MDIQEYIDSVKNMPSSELAEAVDILGRKGIVDCRFLPFMDSIYKYASNELIERIQSEGICFPVEVIGTYIRDIGNSFAIYSVDDYEPFEATEWLVKNVSETN